MTVFAEDLYDEMDRGRISDPKQWQLKRVWVGISPEWSVARLAKRHPVVDVVSLIWVLLKRKDVMRLHASLRSMAAFLASVVVSLFNRAAPLDAFQGVAVRRNSAFPRWISRADLSCGYVAPGLLSSVPVEALNPHAKVFGSALASERFPAAFYGLWRLFASATYLRESRQCFGRLFLACVGAGQRLSGLFAHAIKTSAVAPDELRWSAANEIVSNAIRASERRALAASAPAQAGWIWAKSATQGAVFIVSGNKSARAVSIFVSPCQWRQLVPAATLTQWHYRILP